jgi:hypothetical protein
LERGGTRCLFATVCRGPVIPEYGSLRPFAMRSPLSGLAFELCVSLVRLSWHVFRAGYEPALQRLFR